MPPLQRAALPIIRPVDGVPHQRPAQFCIQTCFFHPIFERVSKRIDLVLVGWEQPVIFEELIQRVRHMGFFVPVTGKSPIVLFKHFNSDTHERNNPLG